MSNALLLSLEEKINQALQIIEDQRLQLEEAEQNIDELKIENSELHNRQLEWEQSLAALLKKLSHAELSHASGHSANHSSSHSSNPRLAKSAPSYKSQQFSETSLTTEDWSQENMDVDSNMDRDMNNDMDEALAS